MNADVSHVWYVRCVHENKRWISARKVPGDFHCLECSKRGVKCVQSSNVVYVYVQACMHVVANIVRKSLKQYFFTFFTRQIVAGGGIYMAYASTLTTYIYDARDFSLVTILGGNDCNVHSLLWHPTNPHRVLVFR